MKWPSPHPVGGEGRGLLSRGGGEAGISSVRYILELTSNSADNSLSELSILPLPTFVCSECRI